MNRIEHQRSRGILPAVLCLAVTIAFVPGCSSSPGTASPTGINESTAAVTSPEPSSSPSSTPTQTPAPTSTPTQTPAPTSTPTYKPASAEGPAENVPLPVMPEAATVESKEGLEAFAGYWYELVNYGYETGDVEPVRAISGPACALCSKYYDVVGRGFEGEDWMAGAFVDVLSVSSEYVPSEVGHYQVLIQVQQEPLEYFGPSGHLLTGEGNETSAVQMIEGSFEGGRWQAVDVVTIIE